MMRQCKRCGVEFPVLEVDQRHCVRCAVEVARLIVEDTKRRSRFRIAKDLTGLAA